MSCPYFGVQLPCSCGLRVDIFYDPNSGNEEKMDSRFHGNDGSGGRALRYNDNFSAARAPYH